MNCTRRDLAKLALAALPAARLLAKPNSNFGGVQIGINAPYSFHGAADSAEEVLDAMVKLGLSAVELRSQPVEIFLGAPTMPRGGRNATDEQRAARRAAVEQLRKWRLSASMDGFKTFRKKYADAGVNIDIVKFDGVQNMTDDELDYSFQIAKALGARFITCEPPRSEAKRIGAFAEKHKLMVGYHGHTNVTGPEAFGSPQSWEEVMAYSKYNGANVDIGHFIAGNGYSPAEYIKKHHDRITNLHIKDRKKNQGPNMPWGQGDTPIKEILQLMQHEKYDFMATIEMEHPIPEGSNTMAELAKCIQYCKDALV
jgi:sugar phosphate isomerase/epimerase